MQEERLAERQVEHGATQFVQVLPESRYPEPVLQVEQTVADEQAVQPVGQVVQVLFEESAYVPIGQEEETTHDLAVEFKNDPVGQEVHYALFGYALHVLQLVAHNVLTQRLPDFV